ncbi:PREDICTED: uncharacterized protein LOC108382039, partial [Rhagoletis zephyria]|uniref:uncharacterized protein LOC108382039 n=1 Tax=Rhagoletis zephyria TaxID=28612 RepID=UPI000811A423
MAGKGPKIPGHHHQHHHHHPGDGPGANNVGDQLYNRSQLEPTKGWDVFIVTPPDDEDETLSSKWVEKFLRLLKLLTILLTFIIVVSCAVLSKGIVLFMTSMIRSNRTVSVCAQSIPGLERDKKYLAVFAADDPERVAWIWSLFFILIVPELMTLFRSARICVFKSYHLPSKQTFLTILIMESLHTVGLSLLIFLVLPSLDVVKGAQLTNCLCFIPALLAIFSRHSDEQGRIWKTFLDVVCMIVVTWCCYVVAKFTCKIVIQKYSFAPTIIIAVPATIGVLLYFCGTHLENSCRLSDYFLPKYLFWQCSEEPFIRDGAVADWHMWLVWLLWLLSQGWITVHNWSPKCERLATTEKLFVSPMYSSVIIDQSLALNRRRDDEEEIKSEEINLDSEGTTMADPSQHYETISEQDEKSKKVKETFSADQIIRIYAVATMWHETTEEMIQMLKSVIRMDEDQSARRNAQKYLAFVDPDYYEFEVHIFFDDAFELCDENDEDMIVNRFVKQFVEVIDTAAQYVHQLPDLKLKLPKKYPTPYGGRLEYLMPGGNKLIAHLKDKMKIRHRKRWSQVMYMYYLLGHKIMELPIDVNRKAMIAENTYLLTLDGDINFRPHAVQLLVDL